MRNVTSVVSHQCGGEWSGVTCLELSDFLFIVVNRLTLHGRHVGLCSNKDIVTDIRAVTVMEFWITIIEQTKLQQAP